MVESSFVMEPGAGGKVAPVRIRRPAFEQMRQHALREYPRECCGLLSGRGPVIETVHPTTNERQSRREFAVPARELFEFFKELRARGRRHLGVYHSHPDADPLPSRRDVEEFHYRAVSYWILRVDSEGVLSRCFRWRPEGFIEAPVQILESVQ